MGSIVRRRRLPDAPIGCARLIHAHTTVEAQTRENGPPAGETGVNIFQGGFAKCPANGTCPFNGGVSYYWYFFGYADGPCGNRFNTGIVKAPKGNAGSGTLLYEIQRMSTANPPYYRFAIDGATQATIAWQQLDICWGQGVMAAEWQNEMLDPADQNGGNPSNWQNWQDVQYKTTSGWHDYTKPSQTPCDANSNPGPWQCKFSTHPDWFYSWDTRR